MNETFLTEAERTHIDTSLTEAEWIYTVLQNWVGMSFVIFRHAQCSSSATKHVITSFVNVSERRVSSSVAQSIVIKFHQ